MAEPKTRFSRELEAFFTQECARCGMDIEEGEPIFFVQNGPYEDDKICENCKHEIESEEDS